MRIDMVIGPNDIYLLTRFSQL